MRYTEIDMAKERLEKLGYGYAFFHEAALAIWGVSYSDFLQHVDVIVDRGDIVLDQEEGYRSEGLSGNAILRIWPSDDVLGEPVQANDIWSNDYGCRVLDPELVLGLLPLSPDFQGLYEARARLAMVLHYDKMSDDELLRFASYVRGV